MTAAVRKTRCVAFDFDGVLADSNAIKTEAYFQIFADVGGSAPDIIAEVIDDGLGGDRFDVIGRIVDALRGAGTLQSDGESADWICTFASRYNDICEEGAATCREMPGASALLQDLMVSIPLYVNSATPQESLRRIVERRGWEHCFRGVFGRPTSKVDILTQILAEERLAPIGMLFVGDKQSDLAAAQTVGCQFVGVRNNQNDFVDDTIILVSDLTNIAGYCRSG